jgi:hypothetical protein
VTLLPRRAYTQPHGELVHLWNHVLYHLVAGSSFRQIDRSSPQLELILSEFELTRSPIRVEFESN